MNEIYLFLYLQQKLKPKNNMYKLSSLLTACLLLVSADLGAKDYRLWYGKAAAEWEECLPLGNGRIGAMVYGNALHDEFQLNENTIWSGYEKDCNNPKAVNALPKVREALNRGDYKEAGLLWKNNAQGPYTGRYLPMGNLHVNHISSGEATAFRRSLDLQTAVADVTYTVDGVKYRRSAFISRPDQVMVIHMTADKKRSVSIDITLDSELRNEIQTIDSRQIEMTGRAPYYVANREDETDQIKYSNTLGVQFKTRVKVIPRSGQCTSERNRISVRGADAVTIYVFAATDYKKDKIELNDCNMGHDILLARHLQDYRPLFNRVNLSLGKADPEREQLPTDERLKRFAEDNHDNGLLELYYQYGRYLLIASSREGGLPANLQGIWNHSIQPPWGSNYTTNINTEMNYWMAEEANLAECFTPLSDFIRLLSVNGAQTAKVNYGMTGGWVAHHNSDAWAQTAPPGNYDIDPRGAPRWSCWPMAGVWLTRHLWEHYNFSQDRKYLADTAYPIMRGAAEFLLQWMQRDEKTGKWGTNPSTSPENKFYYTDKNGVKQIGELSRSSAMDLELAWDLLTNCIEASRILGTDAGFRARMQSVKDNLQPLQIGSKGQILEWEKEFEETDIHHRHVSHLFALYPGREILPDRDKLLAQACRRTLEIRGDGGTGWSLAWKVNLWARLFDGNHALAMLKKALNLVKTSKTSTKGGGVYANLFDAHPPFQIDGNFGCAAGISEMLIQSHAGYVHLLPALPDEWGEGSISGVRVRGGHVIDMTWKGGRVTSLKVTSDSGKELKVRIGKSEKTRKYNTTKGKTVKLL